VPENYLEFTTKIRKSFLEFPDTAEKDLEDFLPELSKKGSRDDVAIAGIWRVEAPVNSPSTGKQELL
jgi:hypothetical protein